MAGMDEPAQQRTVLIIDDSLLVQARLKQLMRKLEFEIVGIASTGAEGLAQAQALPPGLILLDHQLPDAFGPQLAQELRAKGVSATMIAITGTITPELIGEFQAAGVCQVLAKPVDPALLAAAVAACGFTLSAPAPE
jgi:DNA-binding NarL/FixJ family response regulator